MTHLLVIPDGDRRYAIQKGISALEAYQQAAVVVRNMVEWVLAGHDVDELTFFGLSHSNLLKRKTADLDPILQVQTQALNALAADPLFCDQQIRVVVCGQKQLLPKDYRVAVQKLEAATATYGAKKFNLLLGYSGRLDLEQAVQKTLDGETKPTFENIVSNCQVNRPVDFIVRTANELRISDGPFFLTAYAEFHSIAAFFPALVKKDIDTAIEAYGRRNRTFGV